MKSGYPPQSLAIVPELPFSSLGIKKGDQIIVSQKADAAHRGPPSLATPNTTGIAHASSPVDPTLTTSSDLEAANKSGEPVTVAMDEGFLVHRVST